MLLSKAGYTPQKGSLIKIPMTLFYAWSLLIATESGTYFCPDGIH